MSLQLYYVMPFLVALAPSCRAVVNQGAPCFLSGVLLLRIGPCDRRNRPTERRGSLPRKRRVVTIKLCDKRVSGGSSTTTTLVSILLRILKRYIYITPLLNQAQMVCVLTCFSPLPLWHWGKAATTFAELDVSGPPLVASSISGIRNGQTCASDPLWHLLKPQSYLDAEVQGKSRCTPSVLLIDHFISPLPALSPNKPFL